MSKSVHVRRGRSAKQKVPPSWGVWAFFKAYYGETVQRQRYRKKYNDHYKFCACSPVVDLGSVELMGGQPEWESEDPFLGKCLDCSVSVLYTNALVPKWSRRIFCFDVSIECTTFPPYQSPGVPLPLLQ